MNVQAVIFDRDLTLLRHAPAHMPVAQRRIAAIAPGLGLDAVTATWSRWPGPWPRSAGEEPAFWEAFATSLIREHGLVAEPAALAPELAGLYDTFSEAYPDTLPALERLRAAGLRLAVLTNFELPSVAKPLANAGIDTALFEILASSAATGWPKPDPRAYLDVATRLGLPPAACWFVDDLVENVAGARLVGMRAFLIDRAAPGSPADGVIGSLLDLIGLLPASSQQPGALPHARTPYDGPP